MQHLNNNKTHEAGVKREAFLETGGRAGATATAIIHTLVKGRHQWKHLLALTPPYPPRAPCITAINEQKEGGGGRGGGRSFKAAGAVSGRRRKKTSKAAINHLATIMSRRE